MAGKASLFDIKSTMAEIAANIESKVNLEEYRVAMGDKLSRTELTSRLQEKVSFEDMKRYVALNATGGMASSADGKSGVAGPMADRQFEIIDEELRRLKERLEDTHH